MLTHKLSDWTYGRKVRKAVHKTILRKDLKRGVKFLNDYAYSPVGGSTRGSALFLLELSKHIDLSLVYRADFTYSQRKHYTVRLFHKEGYVIQLKGFSYGYYGEGSRGSYAALKACGFDESKLNKLFEHGAEKKPIRMYKRVS